MKPVSLKQLLFHTKCDTLSFYQPPGTHEIESFLSDMQTQLLLQDKVVLGHILEKNKPGIMKVLKDHPSKSHGFYFSEKLSGYIVTDHKVEAYCVIGTTFHVRPLLEEVFTNPEYMVVNVSLYDIKVYRGDFHHLEIIQHYEFDQLPKGFLAKGRSGFYTPQYLGLMPFKTLMALRTIAEKIQDIVMYHSLPVIVTGLSEVKDIFLRYFNHNSGIISNVHEDFYEQTCTQVVEKCRALRPLVLDFYSTQLRERLKRMMKSKRLLTELGEIILATSEKEVVNLVLPTDGKLWGSIDFSSGTYEIHKRVKKNCSVDILNELAEAVIRQGGRVQFLRPHFFPDESHVLAILKG